MIDAIRSEWIKLRTARANLVLVGLALALPLVIAVPVALFADFGNSNGSDTFNATVLGPTYLCVFLSGVIGVLGIGQEYRHNTIRVTFTNDASRSRVMAAKLVVTTLFGVAMGLISQLICFAAAKVILGARDVAIGFGHPGENLSAFVGQVVLCGLFTLAGFGLGSMLRQPAGAIPTLLLWPLIGEGVIGSLVIVSIWGTDSRAFKWLPFTAGLSLPSIGDRGTQALSRVGAGIYFGVFVSILVAIGWYLVERRDA